MSATQSHDHVKKLVTLAIADSIARVTSFFTWSWDWVADIKNTLLYRNTRRRFISGVLPQKSAAKARRMRTSSSIQTVTVGTGLTPVQRLRGRGLAPLRTLTAGGDLHPALKMSVRLSRSIIHITSKKASIIFFTNQNFCSIIQAATIRERCMMRGRPCTCCFTGHRPEKLPWGSDETDPRCTALKRKLYDALEAAYDEGMRHFICGMARGCDF